MARGMPRRTAPMATQVSFSTKVVDVLLPAAPGQPLGVVVEETVSLNGGSATRVHRRTYHCRLLVGADGAKSCVRAALCKLQPEAGWQLDSKPSPAAGLQFQVRCCVAVELPRHCPNGTTALAITCGRFARTFKNALLLQAMPLPHGTVLSDTIGALEPHAPTMFVGKSVDGSPPFKLTAFGVKDTTCPRCLIFTLWPRHKFWQLQTAEEVYTYLKAAFPQITNWDWLTPEEAKRIVTDLPGQFPRPQACKSLVAEFAESREVEVAAESPCAQLSGSAVLLVGDASHSMPPGKDPKHRSGCDVPSQPASCPRALEPPLCALRAVRPCMHTQVRPLFARCCRYRPGRQQRHPRRKHTLQQPRPPCWQRHRGLARV